MTRAYIGLGANQGEPVENLKAALKSLNDNPDITVINVSSVYLTEPVGYADQPWFHNCVAELETGLGPFTLLEVLQGIENQLGRVRTIRWGPRTVDLDILLYNGLQLNDEKLVIPHPRMKERAFVMVPLTEIAPGLLLSDGETVQEATRQISSGEKNCCILQKIW